MPIYIFGQNAHIPTDMADPYFAHLIIQDFGEAEKEKINVCEDLREIFRIYPKEIWTDKKEDVPPMLGEYFLKNEQVVFRPRFPFREEGEYVLEINLKEKKAIHFQSPLFFEKEKTELLAIYPTVEKVPSNLLKMYLEFSAPMGLGNPYPHIFILDKKGEKTEAPFLEIHPPLWDAGQKRLTLWFDPGRIKSGLSPNKNMDTPLEPGEKYTLYISEKWKDAFGENISGNLKKEFHAFSPDYEMPHPELWKISEPPPMTDEPLSIYFFENMDYGVLKNGISVKNESGEILEGEIVVSEKETVWQFFPKEKWAAGNYRIILSENLEDLAGNNLTRPFDRNIEKEGVEMPILELGFLVKNINQVNH